MTSKHNKLYWSQRWRRRSKLQLTQHPLCALCLKQGLPVPATIADHIVPHKGDVYSFYHGALQSLCLTCHTTSKQQEEIHGFRNDIGIDGWPIDKRHPVYQQR